MSGASTQSESPSSPKIRWSTIAAIKQKAARAKSRVVTKREAKGLTNERSGSSLPGQATDVEHRRSRGISGVRSTLRNFWTNARSSRSSSQSRCATLSPAVHNSSADAMRSVPGGGESLAAFAFKRACAAGSAASAECPLSSAPRVAHPSTCLRAQGPRRDVHYRPS